ncbi:MAG: thermitase [Candidatus Binatota bacterium]|nr:thermitase [Candidatus Binatota bacterium]
MKILIGGIGRHGKPLAYWLSLGFFIGWLSAPDFIRHFGQSDAAPADQVAADEPVWNVRAPRWIASALRDGRGGHGTRPVAARGADEPQLVMDEEWMEGEGDEALDEDPGDGAELDDESESSEQDFRGDRPSEEGDAGFQSTDGRRLRRSSGAAVGEPLQVASARSVYGSGRFGNGGGLIQAGQPGNAGSSGSGSPAPVIGSSGGNGPGSGGGQAPPPAPRGEAGGPDGGGNPGPGPGDGGDGGGDPPRGLLSQLQDQIDQAIGSLSQNPYVPGRVLLQFAASSSQSDRDALLDALDPSRSEEYLESIDVYIVSVPTDTDIEELVATLQENPAVKAASASYLRPAMAALDPYYPLQWDLDNVGQMGGVADADIDASEGWLLLPPLGTTRVAILDMGFDTDHPDLRDVGGNVYNAASSPNKVAQALHGTAMAGVLAAQGDNAEGIAGVNKSWANLWLAKVSDDGMYAEDAYVLRAIDRIPRGVRVANLSFGGPQDAALLCAGVAARSDVLFVAATGNEGTTVPYYPAACPSPNVLPVAATDSYDVLWAKSNLVLGMVAAPGVSVLTTQAGGTYASFTGTSVAAAVASGIASLVALEDPSLSAANLAARLRSSGDLPAGALGHPRLNLCRALGGACSYAPIRIPGN